METKKLNSNKVAGIIIATCAIGIMIINYFTNGDSDSYIMPFILLCVSVGVFSSKPKKEAKQIKFKPAQRKVILPILSFAVISGIVVLVVTLL